MCWTGEFSRYTPHISAAQSAAVATVPITLLLLSAAAAMLAVCADRLLAMLSLCCAAVLHAGMSRLLAMRCINEHTSMAEVSYL